jgi:RimJ/RimL family protein N-acetyltransferase
VTKAPERIETERLVLRRPATADAAEIFARYSSDAEVTRFLGWPRHRAPEQTEAFLAWSDSEWERWPAGPYLAESREGGGLLGGTGLAFETPYRASTGYVLARDAWGQGYATEALRAVAALAGSLGVRRLYALCHAEHAASWRVLEKCGFAREATLRRYLEFPNLGRAEPCDTFCYALIFD